MTAADELSLRERKKQRTRKAISDAATDLFAERGFEAVTIEDVAAAADVSKKTVFNYFPCKEDLLFDEIDAAEERLLAAVRERPPGEPVIPAVRRHALATLERMCAGDDPWIEKMSRMVAASPALQAREAEIHDRLAHSLGELLQEERGADPRDCRPAAVARAALAVQRSVVESARLRIAKGECGAALARALRRETERGFALLAEGLGDWGERG